MTRQEMLELYKAAYKQAADVPTYTPGSGQPIQPASGFTQSGESVPYPFFSSSRRARNPLFVYNSPLDEPYERAQIEDTNRYFARNAKQQQDISDLNKNLANGTNINYHMLGRLTTLSPQEMLDRRNAEQSYMNRARLDRNAYLKGRARQYQTAGQPVPPIGGAAPVPFSQKLKSFFSKNPAGVIDSTQMLSDR